MAAPFGSTAWFAENLFSRVGSVAEATTPLALQSGQAARAINIAQGMASQPIYVEPIVIGGTQPGSQVSGPGYGTTDMGTPSYMGAMVPNLPQLPFGGGGGGISIGAIATAGIVIAVVAGIVYLLVRRR